MSEYPIIPKEVNIFNKAYHSQNEDLNAKIHIIKDKIEGYKTSFTTGSITTTNINNEDTDTLISQVKNNKITLDSLKNSLLTTDSNVTTINTDLGTTNGILDGYKTSFSTGSLTVTNLNGTNANTLISQITSNKNTLASLIASLSTTDTNLSSLTTKVTSYIASLTTLSTSIDDTNNRVNLNDGKISVLDGFVLALKRFIDIMLVPINNIPFVDKIKTPW